METGFEAAKALIAENLISKNPVLDLGNLRLKKIPEEISELKHLEVLCLGTGYYDLEGNHRYSQGIREFYLKFSMRNRIEELPKNLKELSNLKSLGLDWNNLKSIDAISELRDLESLSIQQNYSIKNDSIAKLKGLKRLNLEFNNLKDISFLECHPDIKTLSLKNNREIKNFSVLESLKKIESINLSFTKFGNLEGLKNKQEWKYADFSFSLINNFSALIECINIKELSIGGNEIEQISFIQNLTTLNKLFLNNNHIQDISALERLINLSSLSLYNNRIKDLNPLKRAKNLKELNFLENPVKEISILSYLPKIKRLSLNAEYITNFEPISDLKELEKIVLDGLNYDNLDFLNPCTDLQELRISNSPLFDFNILRKKTNLTSLTLQNNQIEDLAFIEKLTKLKTLVLWKNNIQDINSIKNLLNLEYLDLDDNDLSDISPLQNLSAINCLTIGKNKIENINPLQNLSSLFFISLEENKISNISVIQNFKNLGYLDISKNHITELPLFLFSLEYLDSLFLLENPINKFPYELVNSLNCLQDIKNWKNDLKEGSILNEEIKLIIIGNGRVGKSCILDRLIYDKFDPYKSSTHAIRIERWESTLQSEFAENISLSINAWDFGGQDIYHSTHRFFMQSRALVLLVWDWETENKEFSLAEEDNAKGFIYRNYKLPHWLDFVRSLSKKSPVIIVQSKVDRDKARKVPNRQLIESMYDISEYCRMSAKTGRGIKDLTETILETIKSMPETGMEMPISWYKAIVNIQKLKEAEKDISYNQFGTICESLGIKESSQKSLISYLHNIGILYYQPDIFDDKIILDQKWAIEAIYSLFDREKLFFDLLRNGQGKFSFDMLQKYWLSENGFDEDSSKVALSFMESCEICFNITGKNSSLNRTSLYVSPQLLPKDKPLSVALFWQYSDANILYYRYQYSFLHEAFIHRFIVRAGHLAKAHNIWVDGIWIQWNETHGLIEVIKENDDLFIQFQVFGPKRKNLLQRIIDEFEEIHPFEIDFEVLISVNGKDWGKLEDVEEYFKKGKREMLAVNGEDLKPQDFAPFFWSKSRKFLKDKEKSGIRNLNVINHQISSSKEGQEIKEHLLKLVSEGHIDLVINRLIEILQSDDLLLLKARMERLNNRRNNATVPNNELDHEENRVILSVLKIINSL